MSAVCEQVRLRGGNMEIFFYRGVERLIICLGGIFFGYLGYKLFLAGLTAGDSKLNVESKTMKIILSGTGPGLFFMAFGAIILLTAILKGGVTMGPDGGGVQTMQREVQLKDGGKIEGNFEQMLSVPSQTTMMDPSPPPMETRGAGREAKDLQQPGKAKGGASVTAVKEIGAGAKPSGGGQ